MDSSQIYKTAYTAAYARLIEQYLPVEKRLFNDPVAKYFFSSCISSLMKHNVIRSFLIFMYNLNAAGLFGLQVCRTRYIDDILKKALDDGIMQIVILGTGFDTRPYRISGADEIKIFEVDQPIILDKKQAIIKIRLIEDVGTSFYKENYLKPIDRKLTISEVERIAYARIL
jgi:methyltransferase (TIGR00027 family)